MGRKSADTRASRAKPAAQVSPDSSEEEQERLGKRGLGQQEPLPHLAADVALRARLASLTWVFLSGAPPLYTSVRAAAAFEVKTCPNTPLLTVSTRSFLSAAHARHIADLVAAHPPIYSSNS